MRALAVILLAAAVFAGFILVNLRDARRAVAQEEAARERLVDLRSAEAGSVREEGGYRFEWVRGEDLPPVLLARPVDDGGRWFAVAAEGPTYEFDRVLRRAPGGTPDVAALRRHLARPAADRPASPAGGWETAGP